METSTIKKKIETLAAEVSPNAVTPTTVANILTDLTDMLGETRSVMEVDVLRQTDGICLEFVVLNGETGKQEIVNVILPQANPAQAGLMSASDKTSATLLKSWYEATSGNDVVANLYYDEAASGADSCRLRVRTFNKTGASQTYQVVIPTASATRAGVMSGEDKKKLDALKEGDGGGASAMVAARLRLGVNETGQPFRIHGKGLLPTDEVRLYRNVHSKSTWTDGEEGAAAVRKGWREVKYLADEGDGVSRVAYPELVIADDVNENSPLADEVNVVVRVEENGQDGYTAPLIDFFVDYYLHLGDGKNSTRKNVFYIRNGRKTKAIAAKDDETYEATARTVDWAVMVLRDGKPITDFMPFKWLVETMPGIDVPMEITAEIDASLKVSAVAFNHQLGVGKASGGTAELPDLDVVTELDDYVTTTDSVEVSLAKTNLRNKNKSTESISFNAVNALEAGVMTPAMLQKLDALYADCIRQKYSGQNVVVLEYDATWFTDKTAQFNGKEYAVSGGFCVLDLGEKKTINNTKGAEKKFVRTITNVVFLPEGITNYDDAFNAGAENTRPFKVTAKVDMSQCTSAIRMFFNQKGLKNLDVSDWDVSKMKTFAYMFALTGLKTLDVSKWDVSSAETLESVFSSTPFETLDTSKWKTPNCTNMACMFQSTNLTTIDVSSFDTSKVTDMRWMFYSYASFRDKTIIGLTNFDTSKVTDFSSMFGGLRNVTLDLSSFSLESAENVTEMFGVDEASSAKQYVTLGANFFNAPKLSALDLSPLKLSAELRQSLINCFDRKAAGQQTLTLKIPSRRMAGVAALTDEEKAAIEAKGYTLT